MTAAEYATAALVTERMSERAPCEWTIDHNSNRYEQDNLWETTCGESYYITEGTPKENDMRFCNYCGGALKQVIIETSEEDEDAE